MLAILSSLRTIYVTYVPIDKSSLPILTNTQLAPWEPVLSKGNSFKVVLNKKYKQLLKHSDSHGRLDIMDDTLSCIHVTTLCLSDKVTLKAKQGSASTSTHTSASSSKKSHTKVACINHG